VAWADVAVLLIVAPLMGSQMARHWIVGLAVVIYGFGAIANAWVMRGRHFGWAALTIADGLAVSRRNGQPGDDLWATRPPINLQQTILPLGYFVSQNFG
jgi:hypothetical protein